MSYFTNPMFRLSKGDFQSILDRLSQFYIANEDFYNLLESNNYCISLNNYLCFCYGADYSSNSSHPRKIEIFQFVGQIENNRGYYIQSYEVPQIDTLDEKELISFMPTCIYPVSDCNYLRQHIFQFHDKTSLFRSTLFYNPEDQKLYRIHCLISFITLPLYKNIHEKTTFESIDHMSIHLLTPKRFLISEGKKKQILERLQKNIRLCEASIKAHGSLEPSLP